MCHLGILIQLMDLYLSNIAKLAIAYDSQLHCDLEICFDYILVKLHYTKNESPSFMVTTVEDLEYLFQEVWCYLAGP